MNDTMTTEEYITDHCRANLQKAIDAERFPSWKRACGIDDLTFLCHGLRRCMSAIKSGCHYLQVTDEIYGKVICHSTYFNALKSPRRADMVKAVEKQSYQQQSASLSSLSINYLKPFPELDEYRVEAADGHFIQHACHTAKNSKGKVFAAGFIYALNLRIGLLRPLCVVTNGTVRNHEIPALRTYIEQRDGKKERLCKHLYVYDMAAIDFAWWNKQKQRQNFMISMLKENAVASFIESIPFDRNDERNTGVESYSV
ncbi:hypothetical protein MNBD_GAMMA03-124 [hydrothermal vent metagenome]|uniref:Uncharacterized protein n=1 Tax=hydrothermal vent metagenome TaxID=652676 RepID=A0A3B0VZX8_9ZZZZ